MQHHNVATKYGVPSVPSETLETMETLETKVPNASDSDRICSNRSVMSQMSPLARLLRINYFRHTIISRPSEQIIFPPHIWAHPGGRELKALPAAPFTLSLLRQSGQGAIGVHLRAMHRP